MMHEYVERRRAAWNAAFAALSAHMRAHREARAWHPIGTRHRHDADLHAWREHRRLEAAERETRAALAAVLKHQGYMPLANGMYEEL